jgi:outer membrane protein assembly factor BamB
LICIFSFHAFPDNWQVGSGGKSTRQGLSTEYGPEDATLLWQNGVSAVIAQQAVIEGNIVAMSRIFNINNVLYGTSVVAQDLMTGDTLWTAILPVDFPDTDWRSRVSAIRDGKVYATRSGNTNYSYMYALDALTGVIVWKSEGLVNESSTESCAFASDGDLIVGNFDSIIRINKEDGTTVWETDRSAPTSNGQEVSVFGDRGYYWEPSPFGPVVSAIDLNTGAYLFSSEALTGGLIQQLCLFIGPDGIIYAPRSANNPVTDFLFALKDNGEAFEELWNVPIGFVPFSTSAVGPDGSIYTYSVNGEVMRLDPSDGSVLNTSETVFTALSASPRMAIDANGYVFVTNGEFATGKLFSFNPDLTTRWTESITNVNIGGPAIGASGTLVVCGVGPNVRAYQGTYSVEALFSASDTDPCTGGSTHFSDLSNGEITSWEWTFEGGDPATSQLPDPQVYYNDPGTYDVTLTVSDGANFSTLAITDYITVLPLPEVQFDPLPEFFCLGEPAYTLSEGNPVGGTYAGPGVYEGLFISDSAGLGEHTLSYYYENDDGCGDTAYQTALVVICNNVEERRLSTNIQIQPNPAETYLDVIFLQPAEGPIAVELLSVNQTAVAEQKLNRSVIAGEKIKLLIGHLSRGIYILYVKQEGQPAIVRKVVKQ